MNMTEFKLFRFIGGLMIISMSLLQPMCGKDRPADFSRAIVLEEGWHIQSSNECKAAGDAVSSGDFDTSGWYKTSVPSTVLAALVKNGAVPNHKDIYFDKNLEKIPREIFNHSWWYRTAFNLDKLPAEGTARMVFEGINYRANIWLNGKKVAGKDKIAGSFRLFDLDVTQWLQPGNNVLAVEVSPPQPGDFTIGFVDWNPAPPDKNMGLWRGVKLRFSGPVSLDYPFVRSKVKLNPLHKAELTVSAQLVNHSTQKVTGVLKGEIESLLFSQPFTLAPQEKREITFSPDKHKELQMNAPRLWWPHTMGEPNLYRLKLYAHVNETQDISDRIETNFGIREVSDYINKEGHRGYTINGKKVLIRGGGWVDDLLLVEDLRRIEAQVKYTRHMNLNTIRLEGFWGSSHKLYDLADRYGILLMAGWSCQWEWQEYVGKKVDEFGGIETAEEIELVARSLRDQVLWLRSHPSIFVWVLGSDKLPRPVLEMKYNDYLAKVDTSRPLLAACKFHKSKVSGPTAVKMAGPYDYVPPVYWYTDTRNGGAFGFNTETGPGPQPPPLESIKRMIPEQHLWPIDDVWEFHCGRNEFNTMKRYIRALEKRYGKPSSVEEFARVAQVANYEAIRPMFESFVVNKPVTTGLIQWMLNSAWPEMYWQLYDYYLMPNGAFYGTKTACQPVNLVYNYGDNDIYIVNDSLQDQNDLTADIRILDFDSNELFTRTTAVAAEANVSVKMLDLPQEIKGLTTIYFLDMKLKNEKGKVVAGNFYWLSTRKDTLDEKGTTWFVTPIRDFADFTGLAQLPETSLDVTHSFETVGQDQLVHVTLKNRGDKLAFFIELNLRGDKSGRSILPIFWDDNYISLLPGETRTISGRFSKQDCGGETPVFNITGWNLKE
jgi:exo-1,4-beta-D-glucosaminidase